MTAWSSLRSERNAELVFLQIYKKHLSLLMDEKDIDAVCASQGSWMKVHDSLARLVHASQVMSKMFSTPVREAEVAKFAQSVEHITRELLDPTNTLTIERFEAAEKKCLAVACQVEDAFDDQKPVITMDFAGVPLRIACSTAQQFVRLRLASVLKCAALGRATGLPLLPWEEGLVTEAQKAGPIMVTIVLV